MIDKGLNFGMQNWFFLQSDDTDGTYNYYGYINRKGSILIMRTNKTTTAILYYVTDGVFATVWAARGSKTYTTPDQLKDVSV
jgi:hypothetical protein